MENDEFFRKNVATAALEAGRARAMVQALAAILLDPDQMEDFEHRWEAIYNESLKHGQQ